MSRIKEKFKRNNEEKSDEFFIEEVIFNKFPHEDTKAMIILGVFIVILTCIMTFFEVKRYKGDKADSIDIIWYILSSFLLIVSIISLLSIYHSMDKKVEIVQKYYLIGNNSKDKYKVEITPENYDELKNKINFGNPDLTKKDIEDVFGNINKLFTEETKESN